MKAAINSRILQLSAHVIVLSAMSASAAIRYVDVNSANAASPYTTWTTAAKTIQDGIDAAAAGDQILVTNGVYQTGGRLVAGEMTRVAVKKAVTVQSVNGAAVTLIQGSHIMRCLYLTNGAALLGFTLTNGFAENNGGGLLCDPDAVVSNCVLSGNRAYKGGGTSAGTLNNCTLQGNAAYEGAGANGGTLNNCWITGNSATASGGGAAYSALNNCSLGSNSAYSGGGVIAATLNNCTITRNSANDNGGGAYDCTLNGCTITGNSAANSGGGAYGSGPDESALSNCIVYYNSAHYGYNYANSILSYCCTTPLPSQGVGNISFEPQLADLSHLSASSPCRGAGSATYSIGLDIDGESWSNPPSIGCDEYYARAVDGPLGLSLQATYTNVAVGFAVNFTAVIYGHATCNRWEFGDGTMTSNRPYASHSWSAAGAYSVVLQAYNDAYPVGISETITVHVVAQPAHYVAPSSANPVAPYTSWATAAHNIQDAVDAASLAGALVLVTNGVYQTGGRAVDGTMTNRVTVDKPVTVQSVNGAVVTLIRGFQTTNGDGAVRCVYLANGAALVGFTLTNGATRSSGDYLLELSGGGVWCESTDAIISNCVLTGNSGVHGGGANGGTLINCTLSGNSAAGSGGGAANSTLNDCTLTANSAGYEGGGGAVNSTLNNCMLTANSGFYGGGVAHCTLNNCLLTENSANAGGGGALSSVLNNCTLSRNGATWGGGAYGGALINCIVYYNSPENYTDDCRLSYSCTTPLPTNGIANLTNSPLLVDYLGGNLRLQSNSPCINAGSNASAPAGPDLDGNPRIAGNTVDIGAYEFQSPHSLISYAWLQQYNLPTDGSADVTDADGDGLNNWQEWRAGTNPTDALSVLRLLSPTSAAPGVIVSWQSVSGRNYFLERGTDLRLQPPFLRLATEIVGLPGTTTFTDTNAVGAGPFFYRVGVQE